MDTTNKETTEATKVVVETQTDAPTLPSPAYSAFSPARRSFILLIVTCAGFFGPLSGGIYLPALPVLVNDFQVSETLINLTVSVFMLVFAIAPLLWASWADFSGRKPLYVVSFAIYIIVNVLLAAVPKNYGALITLRVFQAFGACSVASLGAGTVADLTEPKFRASALSIFLLGPQIGPILGPVIGGAIADATTWRWIFGFLAISGFCQWLLLLFCLPETLRSRVGDGSIYKDEPWITIPTFRHPEIDTSKFPKPPRPSVKQYIELVKYAPVALVSLNTAIMFASYYCIAITLPNNLTRIYNFSTTGVGLAYIAPGLALIIGSLSSGKFSDWRRAKILESSKDKKVDPESRIREQVVGIIMSCCGTIMYGWFCHFEIHPAAVLASTVLAGFGMTWVFVTSTSYLTESTPNQAASLVALAGLFRNPAAAVAAVIIEPLIQKMGIGWCFTGLGFIILCGVGLVILLSERGPHWRRKRTEKSAKNSSNTGL